MNDYPLPGNWRMPSPDSIGGGTFNLPPMIANGGMATHQPMRWPYPAWMYGNRGGMARPAPMPGRMPRRQMGISSMMGS